MKEKKADSGMKQFSFKLEAPNTPDNQATVTRQSASVVRLIDPKTREVRKQAIDRTISAGIFAVNADREKQA